MLVVVSDASVLIDIEHGELTHAMFSLPWQFAVPDVLFAEELEERHSHLLQFGLIVRTLSSDLLTEVYSLRQQFARTSVNDLLALMLAKDEKCQLLTGDKALREVATKLNVEVRGTIWLVDQMMKQQKIDVEIASVGFQLMRESGSRLPWNEVENVLVKNKNYSMDLV